MRGVGGCRVVFHFGVGSCNGGSGSVERQDKIHYAKYEECKLRKIRTLI